jgi:hypothetical protein
MARFIVLVAFYFEANTIHPPVTLPAGVMFYARGLSLSSCRLVGNSFLRTKHPSRSKIKLPEPSRSHSFIA